MFKHILVPTDGSELSSGSVKRAVIFAREAGAKITFSTPSRITRWLITAKGH